MMPIACWLWYNSHMNHPSSSHVEPTKKQSTPKVFWVITALFLLLVIAGGYLLATKQLVFAFGSTDEQPVTVVSSVCSKETIKKFNAASTATSMDERKATLKSAFDAVSGTDGYANDPNCTYIRYAYYIEQKDVTNAQKEIDALKSLSAKNLYATSQLNGVRSIESMQNDITILSNPGAQKNESSGGQG